MSSYRTSMENPSTSRPEDTTSRMVDNPVVANREPSVGDPAGIEARAEAPDDQPMSQFEDAASILAAQDPDAPQVEAPLDDQADLNAAAAREVEVEAEEPIDPTEEVMGASPGNMPSTAVEEAFIRGEVDVKEEMDRATRRMDYATGRSRPTIDPTPSL